MTGWQGTPGPWRADPGLGCKSITAKVGAQHKQAKRTEVACTTGLWDEAEDKANAKGIAAVPVMVAALIKARAALTSDKLRDPPLGAALIRLAHDAVDDALKAAGVTP